MKNFLLPVLISILTSTLLFADAGILIPRDKQQPDSAILSLEEMEITVRIDNGDARVFVRQVFANHTGGIQEGNSRFPATPPFPISPPGTGPPGFPRSSWNASAQKKSTTS
jgi:Ca-activated chloride channel family protein